MMPSKISQGSSSHDPTALYSPHVDLLPPSRFVLNLPESELSSVERVCFQVEQACVSFLVNVWLALDSTIYSHWFYEDFVREANPQFPSLPLKKFSQIFFRACPVLHRWSSDFEIAFNNFMQYKTRVPVCGAIMLNDTWEKVCRQWLG
jgi:mRNA-decapping enzyme subunit 2